MYSLFTFASFFVSVLRKSITHLVEQAAILVSSLGGVQNPAGACELEV